MESSFLLELVPLLLEDIQCLSHAELLQEVADKIVNNDISFHCLRLGL